jgi:SAM-dependent methyltransferase
MKRSKKEGSSSARSATSAEDELDLYEKMSKYYDIWYEDVVEDVTFYQQMAERIGGPVLECMCGTGRVLIPLARQGYEIAGFDNSYAMLDKLTAKMETLDEKMQESIRIGHADIRNFHCTKKYRMIIVPDHLRVDGQFVISIFNPRLDRPESLMRHRGTKITKLGEVISKFEAQTFDHTKQRTTVHYFLDISRQDKELRRVTTTFTLRYMFEREVTELLTRCGLEVMETYGDYQFGPLRKNSDIMVFVARKAR